VARFPQIEDREPKLIVPALEPFYRLVEPLSWLIIRLACGLIMAVHGWPKLLRVIDMIGGAPPGRGSTTRLVILAFFEFFGGLGVALGLFTRFFAPTLAIELLVITIGYWPVFAWRQDGYEYTLMWGLLMFAIALRGGGPYSLDRKLGFTL
jgi:putative oxidoreductase